MASEESKVPEWTVVYHSGNFKGRGEYLRLMLEDAGVSYQNLGEAAKLVPIIPRTNDNMGLFSMYDICLEYFTVR